MTVVQTKDPFTEEDLVYNRRGELSPQQIAGHQKAKRFGLFIFGFGTAVGLAFTLLIRDIFAGIVCISFPLVMLLVILSAKQPSGV